MTDTHYPEPTVGALIFNNKNEILLVQAKILNGLYAIPGGHVEPGETMVEALVREVKEETGLDVFEVQLIALQECINDPSFVQEKHYIFFDFSCRTDSTDVVLNHEHSGYKWTSLKEALSLPLHEYTKKLIIEYQKNTNSPFLYPFLYNYMNPKIK